jgi:hypothetical protein
MMKPPARHSNDPLPCWTATHDSPTLAPPNTQAAPPIRH